MNTTAFLILVPLIFYLMAARQAQSAGIRDKEQFFSAYRSFDSIPFANSSIAYALQIATIYPFLAWATSGQYLAPILNSLAWGAGIYIFSSYTPRISKLSSRTQTLHEILGNYYKTHTLRKLTSILTTVGLIGVIVGEIYWGSSIIASIMAAEEALYAVMFLVALYAWACLSFGGQQSNFWTDQVQLFFSYFGVFLLFGFLSYQIVTTNPVFDFTTSIVIVITSLYSIVVVLNRRARFFDTKNVETSGASQQRVVVLMRIANMALALIIIASSIGLLVAALVRGFNIVPAANTSTITANFIEIGGWTAILTIILLPLFYQFVDMTNWQRFLSVKTDAVDHRKIKRGLRLYALESPLTWVMFISLGILLTASGDLSKEALSNVLVEYPRQLLAAPDLPSRIVGAAFIVSVIAIMLSTVASVLFACMFIFAYDYDEVCRDGSSTFEVVKHRTVNAGLVFVIVTILLFVIVDLFLKKKDSFITILFAVYTAQLAFAPVVIGMLHNVRTSSGWAIASVAVGAALGIGVGVWALWQPVLNWYPVPIALLSSLLVYATGAFWSKGDQ